MKKIIALVLSLVLLISATAFAVPATAAPSFSIVASAPKELQSGERLCVTVSLGSVPSVGICGFDMEFDYDTKILTYDGAEIEGFSDAKWIVAGRAVSDGCSVSVFNDFTSTPAHVYSNETARVKLYFKTKAGENANVSISAQSFGSVSGCYHDGSEIIQMAGIGNAISVYVYTLPPVTRGDGWYLSGEYLYCAPNMTANDITHDDGYILGKDGNSPIRTGDLFITNGYKPVPVGVRFDVNGDGMVGSTDYMLMKLYAKTNSFPANGSFAACDANADGVVSTLDAVLFRTVLAGGEA